MTIFIVEDDQPLRETFADVLRQIGYRVVAAGNGCEALERMRAQHPSFIFVDLVMPKMNGIELIRAMRADQQLSTVPIAAMTASGATQADGVLLMKKPFRTEAAVALIEKYALPARRAARRGNTGDEAGARKADGSTRTKRMKRKVRPRAPRLRRSPES